MKPHGLQLAGVVAAVVLAVVANVLGARHYRRWDWTAEKRWSISPATVQTLESLEQRVDLWAIAGPGDPLEPSLRQLLVAYRAGSPRLDVHWLDPERDTVQLLDLQRRFGLAAGRTEDGRVATDAVVIVASGGKHWFLTAQDLFEQSDETHVRPREERALTQALRSVVAGTQSKLCFTVGHGELTLDPGRDDREWLGALRDLLEKANYELASVDPSGPDAREPFEGCAAVVIAGPRTPFGPEESNRLRAWMLQGGSLLAALGPMEAGGESGMAGPGLDDVLAPFGIGLDEDLVHDVGAAASIPDTHGEGFFVSAKPHPVTAGLAGEAGAHPPRVAVFFARSLRHVSSAGAPWAAELLATDADAYAKTSLVGASGWTGAPDRQPADPRGPFVVAMAAERAKIGTAAHGPRAMVVGSRFALAEDNWKQPHALHGMAFLIDSALSWLTARPSIVDVPDKPELAAGMRVSDEGRDEVRRYVLVLMPLAALLMGAAVWAWRKSTEGKPYERVRGAGEPS